MDAPEFTTEFTTEYSAPLIQPQPARVLAESSSPYLRQHANDPVHWRLWDPSVMAEAQASGRLIFLSSGYFACHWCHVLHQESFLDPGVAALLNSRFIPVKIDRELEPALDKFLLEFLRALRGSAGWPLNIVLLPSGDPLTGLVYAPRDDFAAFLTGIAEEYQRNAASLTALGTAAREEMHALQRGLERTLPKNRAQRLSEVLWQQIYRDADFLAGGFGAQAKFPLAPVLFALLNAHTLSTTPDWLAEFLAVTLDEMRKAGLRDVPGGGFFRYSETPDWGWPHFEIMLEDQAQLAQLYLRAGRIYQRKDWLATGIEILEFVLAEMRLTNVSQLPLFVSALSALDEAGRDGGYYLWTRAEVDQALNDLPRSDWVRRYFALDRQPTLPGGLLPKEPLALDSLASELGVPADELAAVIDEGRSLLVEARRSRGLPRDEKALVGAHGLLLSALAEANRILPEHTGENEPANNETALLVPSHPEVFAAINETALLTSSNPEVFAAINEVGSQLAETLRSAAAQPGGLPLLLNTLDNQSGRAGLADYAYVAQGLQDWAEALEGRQSDANLHAAGYATPPMVEDVRLFHAEVESLLKSIWSQFADADGWRPAVELPLPGMLAQRFFPGLHRPSPTTLILHLTNDYAQANDYALTSPYALTHDSAMPNDSIAINDSALINPYAQTNDSAHGQSTLAAFMETFDLRPTQALELNARDHAALILWLQEAMPIKETPHHSARSEPESQNPR